MGEPGCRSHPLAVSTCSSNRAIFPSARSTRGPSSFRRAHPSPGGSGLCALSASLRSGTEDQDPSRPGWVPRVTVV